VITKEKCLVLFVCLRQWIKNGICEFGQVHYTYISNKLPLGIKIPRGLSWLISRNHRSLLQLKRLCKCLIKWKSYLLACVYMYQLILAPRVSSIGWPLNHPPNVCCWWNHPPKVCCWWGGHRSQVQIQSSPLGLPATLAGHNCLGHRISAPFFIAHSFVTGIDVQLSQSLVHWSCYMFGIVSMLFLVPALC